MEKINVNGVQLAYDRRGKGTPLVLLHGFPVDHHLWNEILPLLEDTFDMILPDLRGFGESTTLDSFYTLEDFASDIAGLLDHLGIQKAAIAGHSMGGYIARAGPGVGGLTGSCGYRRAQTGPLQVRSRGGGTWHRQCCRNDDNKVHPG
jgi:hypothetical protein